MAELLIWMIKPPRIPRPFPIRQPVARTCDKIGVSYPAFRPGSERGARSGLSPLPGFGIGLESAIVPAGRPPSIEPRAKYCCAAPWLLQELLRLVPFLLNGEHCQPTPRHPPPLPPLLAIVGGGERVRFFDEILDVADGRRFRGREDRCSTITTTNTNSAANAVLAATR